MNVFVAGATGVLGRRAVARLNGHGADVTGVARTAEKQAELVGLGATPVAVSLFDPDALTQAVAGHDVVINLATAIPSGERMAVSAAWEDNHRIRREGSRNLVDAALAAGAHRYVQESIAILYADGGEELLDESAPVAPTSITASAIEAETQAARFAEHGGTGVALRFGYFYGPDSAHITEAIDAARAGRPVEFGPPSAYRPAVTTDDAAIAVVAALGAPTGIYNVADDQPLRRAEHVDALSSALGLVVPPPLDVPFPPDFAMSMWSQRVSNQRFKAVTGWRPRYPSAWEGWPQVLSELRWRRILRAS